MHFSWRINSHSSVKPVNVSKPLPHFTKHCCFSVVLDHSHSPVSQVSGLAGRAKLVPHPCELCICPVTQPSPGAAVQPDLSHGGTMLLAVTPPGLFCTPFCSWKSWVIVSQLWESGTFLQRTQLEAELMVIFRAACLVQNFPKNNCSMNIFGNSMTVLYWPSLQLQFFYFYFYSLSCILELFLPRCIYSGNGKILFLYN